MPPDLPLVQAWYQRMTDIGHGEHREISQADAFTAARDNTPRPIPAEYKTDADIGKPVRIGPSDYALDAVSGTLVGCSDTRYILSRESGDFGTVHVHFPRAGFEVSPQAAS
jgi:hypothetical protein